MSFQLPGGFLRDRADTQRQFRADGPNRLWLTDSTERRASEGKLNVCAVKDVWSNRIVGYSTGDRMESAIAVRAVEYAVARRGGNVAGCVLHSDRGGQFRSRKLANVTRKTLSETVPRAAGITPRRAASWVCGCAAAAVPAVSPACKG
ncbi:DDE-type integrase/transposase/recombinase [Cryptosporangium phraense]|uniref:DDE-type integrase/transposase/recombinase n=1 Tax=Cryptosporangium phraense TaxID=2593070 RepID=UPI0014797072